MRRTLASLLELLYGTDPAERRRTYRLMSREWELAEVIHSGQREYLVLRRRLTGASPLTSRERATVQLALGGATNKEIAWMFGVSASTVGVFLWRAARKLGVTGRDSLFRAFAEQHPDDLTLHIAQWRDDTESRGK